MYPPAALQRPFKGRAVPRPSPSPTVARLWRLLPSNFHYLGMPPDLVTQRLHPLPVILMPADPELCWEAVRLFAGTAGTVDTAAGLSLGDSSCLALAKRDTLPVWTADRRWKELVDEVGVTLVLIR